jgi:hypothetical protein
LLGKREKKQTKQKTCFLYSQKKEERRRRRRKKKKKKRKRKHGISADRDQVTTGRSGGRGDVEE